MQAGKKDQPIYFEAPTHDNRGGVATTVWADAGGNSPPQADWAFILSQRGQESFEAARTDSRETIRICCNYRDDVETTWRLKWLEQAYEITYVDRSQKRIGELWITAQLVGAS